MKLFHNFLFFWTQMVGCDTLRLVISWFSSVFISQTSVIIIIIIIMKEKSRQTRDNNE